MHRGKMLRLPVSLCTAKLPQAFDRAPLSTKRMGLAGAWPAAAGPPDTCPAGCLALLTCDANRQHKLSRPALHAAVISMLSADT